MTIPIDENRSPTRPVAFMTSMPSEGGIQRCLLNLANAFVQQNLPVDMIVTSDGSPPYPDQLSGRVRVIKLHGRLRRRQTRSLTAYVRRENPQVLLISKVPDARLVLRHASMSEQVPIILLIHNTLSHSGGRTPRRQRFIRRYYPKAAHLICVSEGVARDAVTHFDMPPRRVRTIYNPVIEPDIRNRVAQPVDHPWLNEHPRNEPVIVSAGRLVPAKDQHTLIRAVAKLRNTHPCRLIILGEGPQRGELQQLIDSLKMTDSVDLAGWVADALPYMARADLFALSSEHEGLGIVLVEALAAGTPVVSTDCPSGPREILQDGRLGKLTAVGDVDALADAMAQTLESPRDPALLREGAARFVTDVVAADYRQTINQVVNKSPRAEHTV